MTNKNELNDEMLEQVNGGTFDPNTFSKDIYKTVGVTVETHFFDKDEFFDADGDKIDMDTADNMVYDRYGDEVADEMAYSIRRFFH